MAGIADGRCGGRGWGIVGRRMGSKKVGRQMNREALKFWVDCYKAGVQITMTDGRLFFWRSPQSPVVRIEALHAFGVFPDQQPAEPVQWMVDGIAAHGAALAELLCQNPPKPFGRFFYHLLVLEHEALHIERAAMAAGYDIHAVGVDGGQFLIYGGTRQPEQPKSAAPTLPPILSNYRGITI